jgi:hypothetical protein
MEKQEPEAEQRTGCTIGTSPVGEKRYTTLFLSTMEAGFGAGSWGGTHPHSTELAKTLLGLGTQ